MPIFRLHSCVFCDKSFIFFYLEPGSVKELLDSQPTLLRFMPRIGLDVQSGMDFLCLLGMILSFVMMISKTQRGCLAFAILWVLYFSLFQVSAPW